MVKRKQATQYEPLPLIRSNTTISDTFIQLGWLHLAKLTKLPDLTVGYSAAIASDIRAITPIKKDILLNKFN